ncbi:MAG: putative transposase [Cocleimonas sp.]|jgi:putative transposase
MTNLALVHNALPIFVKNEVLAWRNTTHRVIDVSRHQVYLFQLGQDKGFPQPIDADDIESLFVSGEISLVENHSYAAPPILLSNRVDAFNEAKTRFEVIRPIVEAEGYLISSERGKLVNRQIAQKGMSKASIYRLLRLYWTHGQCIEALAKKYENCGAKGKLRIFTSKKPGKQNNDGKKLNAIRTEQHVVFMRRVIEVFYFAKKKDLTYTYRRFVTLCIENSGNNNVDKVPSINSLKHVIRRHYSLKQFARGRYDSRIFNKDIRSLKGSATASVSGPGDKFEIDATPMPIHVVSNHDRSRVLGKPTLYLVVDIHSHLIAGYYIGFYSASYRTATIAILSVVQDKTELLKKYNISPTICENWPALGLPNALLCDKAELFGLNGNHLVEATGMRIENTASGRSEAKGTVERYLGLIQESLGGVMPGKSTMAVNKKAGAVDGRLTACISLHELEEIVISKILLINNCRIMPGYSREKDMPDDMPMTAKNIWDWGIANRTGTLSKINEENLKTAILPKDTAKVSPLGVSFKKLYYYSAELEELDWFLRIKNNRSRPVSVEALFDPMIVNQIYVIVPGVSNKTFTCLLKPQSRAYVDSSFYEVELRMKKSIKANCTLDYDEALRIDEEKTITIVNNAEKAKKRAIKKTAAQRKREIPINKDIAREEERQKLINEFSPQQNVPLGDTKIGLTKAQDEFANPELDELFNLDKDVKNETNGIDDE